MKNALICDKSQVLQITNMSLLRVINLFPYNNWWRLGGEPHIKNQCGGISTLLIFIIVGAVFTFTLTQVFNRDKITVSQTVSRQNFASNYTLSTYQNDSTLTTFMIGIDLTPKYVYPGNLTKDDFKTLASLVAYNTTKENYNFDDFLMQKCTDQHFSKMPYVAQNKQNLEFENWVCLPINRTFNIGGDDAFQNQTFLTLYIMCGTEECKNETVFKTFSYYILKTEPNPYNKQMPLSYSMESNSINFIHGSYYQHTLSLDLNNITTDNSLFPFQKDISQSNGYSLNSFIPVLTIPDLPITETVVYVKRSPNTYVYQRSYQKILDSVSYIGGIFQAIFALFFFMQFFNTSYFQMKLASVYFKIEQSKKCFFMDFIKQGIYNILSQTRFKPDWKGAETRKKIEEAVGSLQDIIYINRRIEFLQKAMKITLERHQLKALKLLPNKNEIEVLRDYKKQKFRDRMIYFLKRNKIIGAQSQKQTKRKYADSIQKAPQGQSGYTPRPKMEEELNTKREIRTGQTNQFGVKNSANSAENQAGDILTSQNLVRDIQMRQCDILQPEAKRPTILDQIDEEELQEYNNAESDNQLIWDIESDLKKLVTEAEKPKGDQRSKKIYKQLESQFLEKLKIAIDQFDGKQTLLFSSKQK